MVSDPHENVGKNAGRIPMSHCYTKVTVYTSKNNEYIEIEKLILLLTPLNIYYAK